MLSIIGTKYEPSAADLKSAGKEIGPKQLVNDLADYIIHRRTSRRSGENAEREVKIRKTYLMRNSDLKPLSLPLLRTARTSNAFSVK